MFQVSLRRSQYKSEAASGINYLFYEILGFHIETAVDDANIGAAFRAIVKFPLNNGWIVRVSVPVPFNVDSMFFSRFQEFDDRRSVVQVSILNNCCADLNTSRASVEPEFRNCI